MIYAATVIHRDVMDLVPTRAIIRGTITLRLRNIGVAIETVTKTVIRAASVTAMPTRIVMIAVRMVIAAMVTETANAIETAVTVAEIGIMTADETVTVAVMAPIMWYLTLMIPTRVLLVDYAVPPKRWCVQRVRFIC